MPNIKMYKPHMNIFWWSKRWIHIKFIGRELTSICVAFYSIILLVFVVSLFSGPEAFDRLISILRHPLMIVINIFLLLGLLFHSITWFNLAPKAMVVKLGEKQVPGIFIALLNYAAWVIISVLLILLVSGVLV